MAVYDRPSTRFNRLLLGDNTRPQSRAAEAIRQREAGLRFPRQPIAPTPSYGLSPMMQGIAQRSAVPYMSPLAKAMRQTPTPTPTPDGTFMQKMSSPQGRALAAAGMAGLQLGGYQDRPVSLGQGIAQMGAAAMGAYDKAQAAKAAADAAAFERRYKATDLAIKAAKADAKAGGMFQGGGFKPGAYNMLIDLAPKIEAGTASQPEQQAYSIAYGEAASPSEVRSYDEKGNETITKYPGANMTLFPKPKGYVEPTQTTKPSAGTIKSSKYATQLQTMANNLNRYRSLIMQPTFDRLDMASGALETPTDELAAASAVSEALRLDLKNLYELGALVGGDFQILDNLLTSPGSVKAAKAGKTSLLLQLDQLERTLEGKLKETNNVLSGTYSTPILVEDREDWEEVPVGSYGKMGNGDIIYKER